MKKLVMLCAAAVATAAWSAPVATTGIPASAYVQDGLIAQWDGIENAGAGQHDGAATSWVELRGDGTYDMAVNSHGSFTANALVTDGKQHAAEGAQVKGIVTMEFGYTLPSQPTANIVMYHTGAYDSNNMLQFVALLTSNRGFLFGTTPMYACGTSYTGHHTVSWDDANRVCIYDGSQKLSGTGSNYYGKSNDRLPGRQTVGGFGGTQVPAAVQAHAIRLYDRSLSTVEAAINANVDQIRFNSADPVSLTWPEGIRWQDGKVQKRLRVTWNQAQGELAVDDVAQFGGVYERWADVNSAAVSVKLTAVPAAGVNFARWTGDVDGLTSDQVASPEITVEFGQARALVPGFAAPGVRKWVGLASALASDAANWLDGDGEVVEFPPMTGDAVVVDADSNGVAHPMKWDLDNVTLASWTQTADYTSEVTFQTGPVHEGVVSPVHGVLSADGKRRELVVTGDIVLNGGSWRQEDTPSLTKAHPGWTSGEGVYRVIARAGGDFTVAAGASVSATNGFRSSQGPGYNASNWGASHGGSGGPYYSGDQAYTATVYGKIRTPVTQGSSGSGGRGGGAIELSCDGAFTLEGFLDAGATKLEQHYTSAGGSVFVTAATLAGAGTMRANAVCGTAGCGGGGRIAVVLTGTDATFDDFTGSMSCTCAKGSAQPGTIYLETPANRADGGELILRGNGVCTTGNRGLYTLLKPNGEDFTFARIVLTNKVNFGIAPDATVTTKELVTYTGNYINPVGGTLVVPDGYVFTNVSLRSDFRPSTITTPSGADGTNYLAKGVTYTINTNVNFGGTFVMKSGSTITHSANGATDIGNRANFSAENLVVENGANLTLAGKGYSAAKGPGKPVDTGKTDRSGSHGGLAVDVGSVKAYGSITRPVTLGSGGNSGAGAGAAHIKIRRSSVIDGTLSATASDWYYSGSGGSIWLETGTLKGAKTGKIVADGFHQGYSNNYYGGGGGRVAVTLTEDGADFSEYLGKIQANGVRYDNGGKYFASGSGTVYLRKGGEAENEGTLIIDGVNGPSNTDNYTDITDVMTECLVGHVVITNYGNLRVRKGAELQVRKSFKNASRYQGNRINGEAGDDNHAPGAVAFVDPSVEAAVTGTNVFMCLKCAAPGKTVRFGAAEDTLTGVAAGGALSLAGTDASFVYLRGLADGTAWLFDFHGKTDVVYADVKDSDASIGDKVSVDDTNRDSGNNQNWGFVGIKPGDTNTWTGAQNALWANAGNWSLGRAPADTDVIKIDAEAHCSPELSEGLTLNRLEIAAGKSLTLNGFSLAVTNGVDCQGTIVCTGSEVLTLDGDLVIKGFTAANSTLVLADTRARSVDLGGQAFRRITVSGTAPSLTFTNGFSSDYLTAAVVDSAFGLTFASGQTVTVGELALQGVIDGDLAGLTLSATTQGSAALLNVTGKGSGNGLIVNDSQAVGQKVFAYNPSTKGNNVTGWVFGISEATWQGGASGNWSEPSNWSGGAVPGADSCVHFTTDATVTLDVDDATAQIFDVADCTVNLKGAKTLTVTSLFEILDGGTFNQASSGNVVRVEGAAYVRTGGVWTHAANGTADASWKVDNGYGINAVITGDFTVEAGGKVSAYGKGYRQGYGPGTQSSASYGARYTDTSKPCYGSMFTPDDLGSGGSSGHALSGGGRVRIVVDGTLTVDGSIDAQGETSGFYNASGGSVWITCGTLAGAGEVQANGANKSSYYDTGCGGRVAVYQTTATDFTTFTGKVTAYGGVTTGVAGAYPERPAGTVYLQSAGQEAGAGKVVIDNNNGSLVSGGYTTGGADLPVTNRCPDKINSYRSTTFELSSCGVLFLTADVTIKELELTSSTRVNLNGHTLTIRSHKHKKRKGWPKTWAANCGIFAGTDAAGNPGKIVWEPYGLSVIVR